jgi:excisionase family DNA binding protein
MKQHERIRATGWPEYPLLKTVDVAKILGVSTRTICLWAECSEIPGVRIGKQWRFRQHDLARRFDKFGPDAEGPAILGAIAPRFVKERR